ncbi:hypothetical protein [Gillisia sp. Hel_I_29]|uniref:hypothetical protein n=1 Tax=Gillisia sp. Hel_I_29 TaxID=1249975 RepID=UPI0005516EE1|nr:hypothetical protein [Gillisia sp. Hel_I_29]
MKEQVNMRRLIYAIWRLISERGIKIIGSILVITAICGFFMVISGLNQSGYVEVRSVFVIFGLVFGPIIYIWILANEFTNNSQGISYLLLPSSIFEKWIINNLLGIGFYFLSFASIFRFLDIKIVAKINSRLSNIDAYSENLSRINILRFDQELFYIPMTLGIIVSLGILIGALHFKKNALFYSLGIILIISVMLLVINYVIAKIVFGKILIFDFKSIIPFNTILVKPEGSIKNFLLYSPFDGKLLFFMIAIPIIGICSWIYYYKIREKDL